MCVILYQQASPLHSYTQLCHCTLPQYSFLLSLGTMQHYFHRPVISVKVQWLTPRLTKWMMSCSHPLLCGVSLDNVYKIIRNKVKHRKRWIKHKRILFLKYVFPNSCITLVLVWITYININTECFLVRNHKMRQTTVKEPVKLQPFYSDLTYKIMKIKLFLCLAACRSRPY